MKRSRKKEPTWSDLKGRLTEFDRPALIGLIQDLYTANKDNQAFLHARFALGEDVLLFKMFYYLLYVSCAIPYFIIFVCVTAARSG
jgi:hypothetical protein